jgi:hypothetical protein
LSRTLAPPHTELHCPPMLHHPHNMVSKHLDITAWDAQPTTWELHHKGPWQVDPFGWSPFPPNPVLPITIPLFHDANVELSEDVWLYSSQTVWLTIFKLPTKNLPCNF